MSDTTTLSSRPYAGHDDLPRLEQFLFDVAGTRPPHTGTLVSFRLVYSDDNCGTPQTTMT